MDIAKAEQILIDNGIEADEASTVLQAIGFALLDKDLYPPKYRASCIKQDKTDDNDNLIEVDLPSEVTVEFEDLNLQDNATDEEIEDAMSEYLVEMSGFCHNGFILEKKSIED